PPYYLPHPHLLSPQFKHVMQPSIMMTAALLHLAHICAPSGNTLLAIASCCLLRASNSAFFYSINFFRCSSSSVFLSKQMNCTWSRSTCRVVQASRASIPRCLPDE